MDETGMTPGRLRYKAAGGILALYRTGDKCHTVRGSGMQAERRNIGKTCWIQGVHLFRGDTEHHYTVRFSDGTTDSVDERCLRRF